MTSSPTANAGKSAGTAVMYAACISTLIVNANSSAVSILLPAISKDTGMSVETLQWAITGYSLVGASVIVTSGALADVFGRRLVFLFGVGLFIASCILIGLSSSGYGVIIGRMIQGASGATILASGLSIISVASSGEAQTRAVAMWGAASAVGAAVGPLVGGVLVDITGWQGLFWLDAVIAVTCIPVALRGVEESNDPSRSKSIDFVGTVLVAGILAPIILGMTKATDWGWVSVQTLGTFAISAVAAVTFVFVEQRSKAPLVDLKLFRNVVLVGSTIAILIAAGNINALGYLVSIYFQNPDVLGMSPLQAGLATLPMTVGLILVTPVIPRLAVKLGVRRTISLGFILSGVGFLALAFVEDSWNYAAFVVPLLTVAVGMGISNGPASAASTSCVPAEDVGAASGISNMARYVGAAVWVAAVASIYGGVANSRLDDGAAASVALAAGLQWSVILLTILSFSGLGVGLFVRLQKRRSGLINVAAAAAAHSHTIPVPAD